MILIDLSDGRKNNGGNSTKATRTDDKRLSVGRRLINQYLNEDVTYDSIKELLDKLYGFATKGDTKAATIYLSYVLGKPKESLDITSGDKPLQSTFKLSDLSDEELNLVLKMHGRITDTEH